MGDIRSPVVQTPLSQLGQSLQPGFTAPSVGLVSYKGNLSRQLSEWAILDNFEQLLPGVWTTKNIGWLQQRPAAFNAGAAFADFGVFIDPLLGTQTLLFQVGDKLYSYNIGTQTETAIKTGLAVGKLPTMRGFFSIVTGVGATVYCNGDIEPRKITAMPATESALQFNGGGWPGVFNTKTYTKPALCQPFGNTMAFAKFQSAAVACDVLISNRGNAETFTQSVPLNDTDAVAFTYPAYLGQMTSMKNKQVSNQSLDEVLICGCTNGIFMITGNSASTYSLKVLTDQIGILSNRCFINFGNDLLFLSTVGIMKLSAIANNAVLVPDALSDPILDYINNIDLIDVAGAHAFHNSRTQTMHFWVPLIALDNQQNGHALVINYNNDGTTSAGIVPMWSTRSGTKTACSIYFNGTVYCGGYDGLLQQWYNGNTFNGAPAVFTARSPIVDLGGVPNQKMSLRDANIVCDGEDQSCKFAAYITQKMTDKSYQRVKAQPGTVPLAIGLDASTALGAWVLGKGAFPQNSPKLLNYEFKGEGSFWEFEISSTSTADALDLVGVAYTLSGGSIQR